MDMTGLFNLDNPVWVFLGKLVDMILLTGLWLVFSLPIVTAGASTIALYEVSLKLSENREGYIAASFFRSFKQNLKQGTVIGLLTILLGVFLVSDLLVYYHMEGKTGVVLFTVFALLTVVYLFTALYIFPLAARCETDLKHLAVMAFVMSCKHLGWTILMLTLTACIFVAGVFIMAPLLVVSVGLAAYINSKILNMIFKEYHLELS